MINRLVVIILALTFYAQWDSCSASAGFSYDDAEIKKMCKEL
jgi:hypothetical protein